MTNFQSGDLVTVLRSDEVTYGLVVSFAYKARTSGLETEVVVKGRKIPFSLPSGGSDRSYWNALIDGQIRTFRNDEIALRRPHP